MLRFCKASSREQAEELLEHPEYWAICLCPGGFWAMAWSEDLDPQLNDGHLRNKLFSLVVESEEDTEPLPVGAVLEPSEGMLKQLLRLKTDFKGFTPTKTKKKK